jgi:hypothetical protein
MASIAYSERVQSFYEAEKGNSNLTIIGLIKEQAVIEKCVQLLPDMKFHKMFLIDSDTGMEVKDKDLWKKESFDFFLFKIFDLCNVVERELKFLDENILTDSKKAVYLAEASPDLLVVREEISRELIRHGYRVFPEKSIAGTSKSVEKSINDLLQKSALSIHLFGKLYQEAKPGEVQRLDLENRLAANLFLNKKDNKKGNAFKRIIWLPDNLTVSNEKQVKFLEQVQRDKKLYAGAEIIMSSVEELKDIILEKLEDEGSEESSGNTGSEAPPIIEKKVVYVVISEKNKEGGESVKKMLEHFGCEVMLNHENKRTVRDGLRKCNSILFYYQNEKASWLRSKMCEMYKAKSWEYSSTFVKKGVITFENQELPNDDFFKEVVHIKANEKLEYENLVPFFNKAL